MKVPFFAIGILCAHGATAATVDNYAYAWPLQTNGDSAAWQVDLTPEIYVAIQTSDLRDVEVVNAAGESVPRMIRSTSSGLRPARSNAWWAARSARSDVAQSSGA